MKGLNDYLGAYQRLHAKEEGFLINGTEHPSGSRLFDGSNFVDKLYPRFRTLVDRFQDHAPRVLDYGCGKAAHLHKGVVNGKTLFEDLGPQALSVYWCHDPGFHRFEMEPPRFAFDILICADVMEHVPERYVDDTLDQMADSLELGGFALFTISGKPAKKHFLDGENLHCTVKTFDWWKARLRHAFLEHGHHVHLTYEDADGERTWTSEFYDTARTD